MTDRERLIELMKKGYETVPVGGFVYEGIADYLLANGVIVPPCNIGDMVYVIDYCRCGKPENYQMRHCHKKPTKRTPKVYSHIMVEQKGKRLKPNPYFSETEWEWRPIGTICYKVVCKPFKFEWLTRVGTTVFLTLEEAKKSLPLQAMRNTDIEIEGE